MSPLMRFALVLAFLLSGRTFLHAQAINFAEERPFVIGVVPVVGNGAVGGVAVDADGTIKRAEQRDETSLLDARRSALDGLTGDIAKPAKLRKVSLRRLDALLASHASQNKPLPPEVLYLAGLQRIEYVFAYPEANDLVLAGPAEGWLIDDAGNAVGESSGAPVLQLEDLIAALRTSEKLLAGEMISCSIDPTPAGVQQFARLMRGGRASPSARLLRQIEQAMGPQTITLTGVSPESHFAQVLVAADWQMKRLGMGLAESPVDGLPSYMELLQHHPGAEPDNAMPRWWMAYGEQPVECDKDRLGWRLSPPGIRVCTAAGRLQADGRIAPTTESDPLAKEWADAMTAKYDRLAIVEPVFGQLRGCMDLALVAAILTANDLTTHLNLELPMLLDDSRLQLAAYRVPKTVASQANAVKKKRAWVISVSGGVDLDVASIVNRPSVQAQVQTARMHSPPGQSKSWWWD
ncbi:DUF1598 domain-containing protein [Lacipirellula parvula]|uniref:DUF1598 domain-containing protein n=1 Tax=Lacipirellula parvula TaxID=2650471 RepID=A0A5K7XCB5_9BACT|nr:DUF1598 domain-containing protein [Lacipirellula parvula]BBO31943.1 hypothetical protein PLANPX_1555 [Lacipirellula parvula]